MKSFVIAAAAVVALAFHGQPAWPGAGEPGHGHGHGGGAFGQPGDPKKPARVVNVVMKDGHQTMAFVPNRIEVKKGEQVRFRLRNDGAMDHEMVLATLEMNLKHAEEMKKNPDMEHDDPNAKRIGPMKSSEILWRFDTAGTFDFSCLIPGHREAGMTGTIIVK